ncbi:hypothetical protein E1B28_000754 [Marasmius oreades]|uniref:SWIM-type domain-containing protein n=1 Tax=Marasmius oreades TaxID=181124 RepID=A0A9P7V227_9AGAR|nr:uncharacterized protein E1B28_000754 [Marasmius oreades]KAG7098851.1 hypothetical protein E1B28_000754 [Marasmius oreades]
MQHSTELIPLVDTLLANLEPRQPLPEDFIHALHSFFPDSLILAALDLIDRQCVIKNISPWGHIQFDVLGSTATYTVLVNLSVTPVSAYCTCPAFVFAVLISQSHIMCKHILAARLAQKLSLCIERPLTLDGMASLGVSRNS